MNKSLERIDRSFIYQSKPLFDSLDQFCIKNNYPKLSADKFLEGILFLSHLMLKKDMNLFGEFEFEFSLDDYAAFTGKSKKSISKSVKGFSIEQEGFQSKIEVLDNELEHFLWIVYNWDLPIKQVYKKEYFQWYRPGVNTIINNLCTPIVKEENGKKINYGKKKYLINISSSYTELLLKQFIQIDLKKINILKSPRNSYTKLYLFLLQQYNEACNKKDKFRTANISFLCELAELDFSNYKAENRHKKTSKILNILNSKFKETGVIELLNVSKLPLEKETLLLEFNITGQRYIGNKNEDDLIFIDRILTGIFREVYNEIKMKQTEKSNYAEWFSKGLDWPKCIDKIIDFYKISDINFLRILYRNDIVVTKHFPTHLGPAEISKYLKTKIQFALDEFIRVSNYTDFLK